MARSTDLTTAGTWPGRMLEVVSCSRPAGSRQTVAMSESDDEWLRPIDLTVDSYAPEQIAGELGARHALFLREAQRLFFDGLVPDESGLADGIRAETRRYLRSHPWLDVAPLAPVVTRTEDTALAALAAIVAAAPPDRAGPPPDARAARPVRRLALQPSATIVGNMAVRKQPAGQAVELSWDAAANVTEWTVRVSDRPDPRRDYVEGDVVTLPANSTSVVVPLDDHPRRIQLYGHGRDGRVVRRAVISALTNGNSGTQWKRQATAS